MKPKTMILMVVAVACGLVASYMTSRLLADRNNAPPETTVTVVVAKKKVAPLTIIRKPEEMFELQQVPEGPMTAKAVKSLEELQNKRVKNAIKEGDFIRVDDLQKKDELIIEVPPGQRAIAIKVRAEQQLSGLILPGMRVDVLCTLRGQDAATSMLLQNMLVLAIDSTVTRPDGGSQAVQGQTVSLAATPQECEHLLLAQSSGELCLALRSPDDRKSVAQHVTRIGDLFKGTRDRNPDTGEVTDDNATQSTPVVPPPTTEPTPTPTPTVEPKKDPEPPAPVVEEPKREQFTLTVIEGRTTQQYKFLKDLETGVWFGGRSAAADDDAPPPAKPKQNPAPAPSKDDAKSKG